MTKLSIASAGKGRADPKPAQPQLGKGGAPAKMPEGQPNETASGKAATNVPPANEAKQPQPQTQEKEIKGGQPGSTTALDKPAAATGATLPTLTYPKTWEEIQVGSVVLSQANEGDGFGWWEAVVVGITNDLLTLRWRDYPRDPIKARRRHEVGLLQPR